jgi:hypothetical protein
LPTIKIKSDRPKGFRIINLSSFDPAKHERYDAPLASPAPVVTQTVVSDPPKDPLDLLPENWREAAGRGITKLKEIAEAVTGRTPADKNEAVAMIEAALAEREKAKQPAAIVPPPPPL